MPEGLPVMEINTSSIVSAMAYKLVGLIENTAVGRGAPHLSVNVSRQMDVLSLRWNASGNGRQCIEMSAFGTQRTHQSGRALVAI